MAIDHRVTAKAGHRRFEDLAEEIAGQIAAKLLRPGDRLPSIRQTCRTRHLSPSTVFQAYDLLENRGLIRAAPRSGYFVNPAPGAHRPEPVISTPPEGAHPVEISDLVYEVLSSVKSHKVVPLGSAFPSPLLFPLDNLRKALSASTRSLDIWSTYDDLPPGNERLRRAIGKRYLAQGLSVAADEIVLTNGALEALNLCLQAVARPGDAVVVEAPSFYAALLSLERLQLKAIEVPTHPRGGCGPCHAGACSGDPKAQSVLADDEFPESAWLLAVAKRKSTPSWTYCFHHEVPLIEDDVYGELHHGNEPPSSAKTFDRHGLVMHCSSFSKTLSPGYRVGWVAAGRFADSVRRLKLMTSLTGSAPDQATLAA